MHVSVRLIVSTLAVVFGLVAVGFTAPPKPEQNIAEVAMAAPNLHTLVKALKAADMVDDLKGAGPLTVFAPTDEAFAKIPADQLDALLKDKARLRRVLSNHVVSGDLTASKLTSGMSLESLNHKKLSVSMTGGTVRIDKAKVVKPDIAASNGVIHEIDTVIMPD